VIHDTSGLYGRGDVTNRPCPTITIGVNAINSAHYQVEYYLTESPPDITMNTSNNKPIYQVPTMEQIVKIPWNGYNVVSTFSGCGGSCLGYRMAGYRVVWASEFIPAAQATYKANHPNSILDTRDIRKVQPEDILAATGLGIGEIDILDGSPPCAAFSTAGKREKGWGKVKQYSDTKQRVDDLFFEYARILKGVQPKVFVAENVSGLIKGTAKGYFIEILKTLKASGYRVKCKVLDAQWLGVPQMRQRTIFVGVREDLGLEPVHPKPLNYQYTVRDALPWILKVGDNGGFGKGALRDSSLKASSTIGASPQTGNGKFPPSLVEAESDISKYAIGREWGKIKQGEKSEKYLSLTKPHLDKPSPCVTQRGGDNTCASVVHPTEKRKFSIAELRRICAFPDDFILTGTYAQQWERLGRAVPPVMMMHIAKTIQLEILDKLCAE